MIFVSCEACRPLLRCLRAWKFCRSSPSFCAASQIHLSALGILPRYLRHPKIGRDLHKQYSVETSLSLLWSTTSNALWRTNARCTHQYETSQTISPNRWPFEHTSFVIPLSDPRRYRRRDRSPLAGDRIHRFCDREWWLGIKSLSWNA